jgi:hypothetical protein
MESPTPMRLKGYRRSGGISMPDSGESIVKVGFNMAGLRQLLPIYIGTLGDFLRGDFVSWVAAYLREYLLLLPQICAHYT